VDFEPPHKASASEWSRAASRPSHGRRIESDRDRQLINSEVVVDRLAISALLRRAEHEQALRLAIIVIDGAGCEPGRCTLGPDVALSHNGTDGARTTVLPSMVQAVKQRSEVAQPLSRIFLP
jgi:hypothetical protein